MDKPQVDYELVVVDELPPRTSHQGGAGKSILNEQLEKIVNETKLHGKIVRIGLYTKGTAATAAKNVLQQRNGRTAHVLGWKFETRRVPRDPANPEAGTDMGLFAIYTPEAITVGALELHLESEKARKAKIADERAKREAEGEEPEPPEEDDADPDPDDYLDDEEVGEDEIEDEDDEDEEPFE